MSQKLRRIIIFLNIAIFTIVIIFILLYSYTTIVDKAILKLINLAANHDIQIKYSRLEGNILKSVRINDVEIIADKDTLRCKAVRLKYDVLDLISGEYDISDITLDRPDLIVQSRSDTSITTINSVDHLDSNKTKIAVDLSGFPKIKVDRIFINNGNIQLKSHNKDQIIENIYAELAANISSENVNIHLKYLKGNWLQKDVELKRLTFKLIGNKKRVTINQFELEIEETEVIAHGEIELIPRLKFYIFTDTSDVQLHYLKKIFPDIPYQQGKIRFYGNFIGNPENFNGEFFLSGNLDSLKFKHLSCDYFYRRGDFALKNLVFVSNFGELKGLAEIAPQGRNRVDIKFKSVNLEKINLTPFSTYLNGAFDLDFNYWNLNKITGKGKALFTNTSYGNIKFDLLNLNVSARKGNWTIKEGSKLVFQEASQFFVQGTISKDRILDLNLFTKQNMLDTLDSRLNLDLIGGVGSMSVSMTGEMNNPNIKGNFLLDSLEIKSTTAYGVEGRFEIKQLMRNRIGFFNLDILAGMVSDILITDGNVSLNIDKNLVTIDSVAFYSQDNSVRFAGKIKQNEDSLYIDLHDFLFKYRNYAIKSPDTLQAFYYSDSLFIENFVLNAPEDGLIEVRGMLNFVQNSAFAIYFQHIKLAPFNEYLGWKYDVSGLGEISLEFTGQLNNPHADLWLNVQKFALDKDTLGNIRLNGMYDNRLLTIEQLYFKHADSSYASLQGYLPIPIINEKTNKYEFEPSDEFKISSEIKNIEISDYFFFRQYNFPLKGQFNGNIQLEGTTSRLKGLFNVSGRNVRYREYFSSAFQLNGRFKPEQIKLDFAKINFMNTEILGNGTKIINWNLNEPENLFSDKQFLLNIAIKEDSVNFLDIITPEVDQLTGQISLNTKFGGEWDQPKLLDGTVNISNGTLVLSKIENPVSAIELSAFISEEKLIIDKAKARMTGGIEDRSIFQKLTSVIFSPVQKLLFPAPSRGELEIDGNIDFSILDSPKFNLTAKASKIYANYFLENVEVLVSSNNLRVTGRDTLFVNGDISVHQGEVFLDLQESEKNLLLSPTVRETPPYLRYLVNLSTPGNFFVRSDATFNSFDFQLEGDVSIIQEPNSLVEVNGNLNILSGKYFQFEEFDIQSGRIEFLNPKELPQLDLIAEKRKYGYIFELDVNGPLNNPTKEIRIFNMDTHEDITHLYPETKDQIALLLFGVTFEDLTGKAGSILLEKGQEIVSQALISQIENEARRFIGLDAIRLESPETRNRRLNQSPSGSRLALGKYLTPQLYLEYKTQLASAGLPGLGEIPTPTLSWESGNQLYLEYRINRNWSISTFYEKRENDRLKIDVSWRLNF